MYDGTRARRHCNYTLSLSFWLYSSLSVAHAAGQFVHWTSRASLSSHTHTRTQAHADRPHIASLTVLPILTVIVSAHIFCLHCCDSVVVACMPCICRSLFPSFVVLLHFALFSFVVAVPNSCSYGLLVLLPPLPSPPPCLLCHYDAPNSHTHTRRTNECRLQSRMQDNEIGQSEMEIDILERNNKSISRREDGRAAGSATETQRDID